MKYCSKCKKHKELNVRGRYCKKCAKDYQTTYRKANKDKIKASRAASYKANIKEAKAIMAAYYKKNADKLKVRYAIYRKTNKGKINALAAKRHAAKLRAIPYWLTKEHYKEIQQFYIEAKKLSRLSKNGLDVDHIVPLQGKNVCGLHVPWNLQILTKSINCSKNNKF